MKFAGNPATAAGAASSYLRRFTVRVHRSRRPAVTRVTPLVDLQSHAVPAGAA